MKFQSTKVFEGYSCCFRQWRATHSHCQYLHAYVTKMKIYFEGDLDDKGWIQDFGGLKDVKKQLDFWLDHTTLVASDDPKLELFKKAQEEGIIQLRILPSVGAEKYAEFVYNLINTNVFKQTCGRVRVVKVEFFEHDKNSAIYSE